MKINSLRLFSLAIACILAIIGVSGAALASSMAAHEGFADPPEIVLSVSAVDISDVSDSTDFHIHSGPFEVAHAGVFVPGMVAVRYGHELVLTFETNGDYIAELYHVGSEVPAFGGSNAGTVIITNDTSA